MGIEPAGENGTFYQSVPLRSILVDREQTTFTIWRNGKEQALIFSQDFLALGDPGRTETFVGALLVFVGYGVTLYWVTLYSVSRRSSAFRCAESELQTAHPGSRGVSALVDEVAGIQPGCTADRGGRSESLRSGTGQ